MQTAVRKTEVKFMKNIFDWTIYIASVCGAAATIIGIVMRWLNKKLTSMIEPMQKQIHKMDVKECRRFLIDFLIDVEHGAEKDEVQWKFAHDVYDHYANELRENSYVKDKWERVVTSGNHE